MKDENAVIKENNSLEVIYSTITGPIDPIRKDEFKYVINVDDNSGCTSCYRLK